MIVIIFLLQNYLIEKYVFITKICINTHSYLKTSQIFTYMSVGSIKGTTNLITRKNYFKYDEFQR